MNAYLLTWNPKLSASDEPFLRRDSEYLAAGKKAGGRWSSGNNQHIEVGDRVFLLKQGSKQPGLMGSGWVTKGSYWDAHRDPAKRKAGIRGLFVQVAWDGMVPPELVLTKAELREGHLLPDNLLKVACSGPVVPAEFAARIEKRWAKYCSARGSRIPTVSTSVAAWEGQTVEHRAYRRKRDWRLKQAALEAANGVCAVCEVDYSKLLDGNGIRVLQVHHKHQLAEQDAPRLNSIDD